MGGAWSAAQIILAFRAIGYTRITINSEEVTEAYARKWGHGLAIREYIQSSLIYAEKPKDQGPGDQAVSGARRMARGGRVKSGKLSGRFSRPPVAAADADQQAAEKAGDVGPPGDTGGGAARDAGD